MWQLEQIIPKIDDDKIREQVENIGIILSRLLELAQKNKGDLPIPPLYASITEENSVLIEWIFPDFRIGFNIESNPDESGMYIVAGDRLDDSVGSKKLGDIKDDLSNVVTYVLSNI